MSNNGEVGFIIRGLNSKLVAAGSSWLYGPSVPWMELRAVWTCIIYARLTFRVDRLMIEDNFSTVIG